MKTKKELMQMDEVVYGITSTTAFFDGENYFNDFGQRLRSPNQYNHDSEGYTPFGDE